MQLKNYQQRSLDVLAKYFQNCKQMGNANLAFYATTLDVMGEGINYHEVDELPGLPYVCLRVPTGGGKTLMASNAVSVATCDFLGLDHSFVLWLTPSTTIRDQTLKALKDRKHPYRTALESTLGGVTVLELSEALYLSPSTLNTDTVILVTTTQAFRIGDPELRKVYEASGALMSHFDTVPASADVDRYENGKPVPSLANLLRLHRPIVIVDEAQNVRSALSFETLARFNPSCILEFTATPHREDHPSNVLYSISARELKAESMIKLPLQLETRPNWKELIGDAILKLKELEGYAEAERAQTGDYLRPIMLLQAQPLRSGKQTVSVEVVESCLLDDYNIPSEQIIRATGKDDKLSDIEDLTATTCPVRYIITVQKLREGWDCSFAYVLCSVAEQSSATAVEQIVGRVLRMPKATRKQTPELNMAYAFIASTNFIETLNTLADALVENGFEKQEAAQLVTQPTPKDFGPLFGYQATSGETFAFKIGEVPALEKVPEELSNKVRYDVKSQTIELASNITAEEIEAIIPAFKTKGARKAFEQSAKEGKARVIASRLTPSERGETFSIPVLAYRQGKLLEQLEETHFLDYEWELPRKNAVLTETEFTTERPAPKVGSIDMSEEGKVKKQFLQNLNEQLSLLKVDLGWSVPDLVHWLDRNFLHHDLTATETGVYLTALVNNLIEKRNIPLDTLVREKYRLRDAVIRKIDEYRQSAHEQAFKSFFDTKSKVEVTPDLVFSFDPQEYPAPVGSLYRGQHSFKKHYYPEVGKFDSNEEKQCAEFIDSMDEVEYWARNISNQPSRSFWFQTSTDRFYPDFVCKLKDGRYLVVEYKGAHLYKDAEGNRQIGDLWEKRSKGKCLFIMPTDKKYDAIQAKIK